MLIYDVFSTDANAETLSGKTVINVSDHLAHFFSFPVKQTPHKKKTKL